MGKLFILTKAPFFNTPYLEYTENHAFYKKQTIYYNEKSLYSGH